MEYFSLSLSILSLSGIVSTARDPHRLTAVSGKVVAEALYQRIRGGDPDTEAPPEMDPDTKNRICYHITSRPFITKVGKDKQIFIHNVYKNLVLKDPKLFLRLYESLNGPDLVYTNFIKPVDVYAEEEDEEPVREYVFVCLTIDESANEEDENDVVYIRANLISKEYNLSDDPAKSQIAGRFLFLSYPENCGRYELFSVAEEPAESLSNPGEDVEHLYMESKEYDTLEESADIKVKNSICQLDDDERLRICTIVLSSLAFEKELKFVPDYQYIDEERCFKHQISFRNEQIKLKTAGKVYEEWMIRCIPMQRYAKFQAEFFLSRIDNSDDKVFVYRWDEGAKLVIENQMGNVRFRI